jgi:hypothetical protein
MKCEFVLVGVGILSLVVFQFSALSDATSLERVLASAQRDVKLHRFDRAIEQLEPFLDNISSPNPAVMMCLVRAYYGAGNLPQAIEYCSGLQDCGVDWIVNWAQAYLSATLIPAAKIAEIDLGSIPNCDLVLPSDVVEKIDFQVPDSASFWEFIHQEIAPILTELETVRRQLPLQIGIAGAVAAILFTLSISFLFYLAISPPGLFLFILFGLGCFGFCSKSFLVFAHSAISSYRHHPQRPLLAQRMTEFIDGGNNRLLYHESSQAANSDREMFISELFTEPEGRKLELSERDCIHAEWHRHRVHIGHYYRSSTPPRYQFLTAWWHTLSGIFPLLMLDHPASVWGTIARGSAWLVRGIGRYISGKPIPLRRLLELAFTSDIDTHYLDRGLWIQVELYGCKLPEIQAISNRISQFEWRHLMHLNRGELVMTDDKYFDRSFTVRTASPSLSKDLFGSKLCDLLLKLHTDCQCDVDLRAIDNRIYLKLGIDRDWFTPKLFTNMCDLQSMVDYLAILTTTIAAIVEILDSAYLDRQTATLPAGE